MAPPQTIAHTFNGWHSDALAPFWLLKAVQVPVKSDLWKLGTLSPRSAFERSPLKK